ncbi:hypothetical protein [Burkholderia gladioli]|uniref:hypothetical protein n=1 Tax=Burkholderia gladioli TaxID=28095 RepID=UPI00163E9F18|nr:hypothetical protein [Burkholderia gladioli]MBJ9675246.1 hypothetical protein [Burkholderia gladioli]MDN7463498.1 hypothetical protein [Burkholderia gladioli]
MADRISMDDFNASADKAIEERERERIDLVMRSLSLPSKGKLRDELVFSEEVRLDLRNAAIEALKTRCNGEVSLSFIENDADGFVTMLERSAQGMSLLAGAIPDKQKRRIELLASLSGQAIRLAETLETLDSEALGWLLATLDESGQLKNDPLRAVTEAREQRVELMTLLPRISAAATTASQTLPSHDFQQSEPKYQVAKHVEHMFWQIGLIDLYVPSKKGLAYKCLLEVFSLAEQDAGEPGYWIKKVREDPSSMTALVAKYASS